MKGFVLLGMYAWGGNCGFLLQSHFLTLGFSLGKAQQHCEVEKHGVRSPESWIQVLSWLLPLNMALGMAQPLPGPPVFLVQQVRQSPMHTWEMARSKRWVVQHSASVLCTQRPCLCEHWLPIYQVRFFQFYSEDTVRGALGLST